MTCNATLTTATLEGLHFYCDDDHDEDVLCSGWGHVTLHELTCVGDSDKRWGVADTTKCVVGWHESAEGEVWHDDTEGATPDPAGCVHCHGERCMSPTHRGADNACCVCGDWLPDDVCPDCDGTGCEDGGPPACSGCCRSCGGTGDRPGAASHADNTPPADVCPVCKHPDPGECFVGCPGPPPADECDDCNGSGQRCQHDEPPYEDPCIFGPCPSCGGSGSSKADLSSDWKDRPDTADHTFTPKEQGGPYCDVCDWHRNKHRPAVTDAEVNAACEVFEELDDQQTHWWDVVRAALEAAAATRTTEEHTDG